MSAMFSQAAAFNQDIFGNRLSAAGIPILSPPALALLAILMTLMAGWARQRGRRG